MQSIVYNFFIFQWKSPVNIILLLIFKAMISRKIYFWHSMPSKLHIIMIHITCAFAVQYISTRLPLLRLPKLPNRSRSITCVWTKPLWPYIRSEALRLKCCCCLDSWAPIAKNNTSHLRANYSQSITLNRIWRARSSLPRYQHHNNTVALRKHCDLNDTFIITYLSLIVLFWITYMLNILAANKSIRRKLD